MKVLLVYPSTPETFWSFKHVLPLVPKRAAFPPLGMLTVAGLLPKDWEIRLLDLNVEPLGDHDLRWADYVMLSAMIVHRAAVTGLMERCRRLAKPVIAGGPLFFSEREAFPGIAHFVVGEAEAIMPRLIEDLRAGTVRPLYVAEFIQRSGVVPAMVGLLNALPETRLYHRLKQEGRLLSDATGNNTEAKLNFRPKLGREFLINGYRDLMRRLYEPRHYYQRVRTLLERQALRGPRLRLSWADLEAFLKSLWLLGIWHRGRRAYWRLLISAIVRRPRQFHKAMELAIMGHHFRRVASNL